jgi:hypothetical protein
MTVRKNSGSAGTPEGVTSAAKTRIADRAASTTNRERRRKDSIPLAAQKWYEELLEKCPRMKPAYRDVPDEKNGYLQLLLLAESVKDPRLPGDPWDSAKFQAWLSENQSYFDRILHIAELTDRSTKGVALNRLALGPSRLGSEFATFLRASARLAFEGGDHETALRYMKASVGIGDHMVDIEAPTMLGEVVSVGIRNRARDSFREDFLPTLAGNPEALRQWRDVIFRDEMPASEYSRAVIGEWNTVIRNSLLPALLGDRSIADGVLPIDDAEALIDSYTRSILKSADGVSQLGLGRYDVSNAMLGIPTSAADGGKMTAESLLVGLRGIAQALGREATVNAMNSAAISLMLGEEPPVDPVSGKPFLWDPKSRLLTALEGGDDPETVKVP